MKNIMLIILMQMYEIQMIARAKASKLVFLTDNEGVLQDPNNPNTLISKIDTASAKELFEFAYYWRNDSKIEELFRGSTK